MIAVLGHVPRMKIHCDMLEDVFSEPLLAEDEIELSGRVADTTPRFKRAFACIVSVAAELTKATRVG